MKNLKFGKRFIAGILAASIIGCGIGGYHLHKRNEINRVKGYLEDFATEDNYVDLSKISTAYEIYDFSGEVLRSALEEMDIDYVRITDSYIYDDVHVETFKQKNAVNYSNVLWTDGNGNPMYEMYEPIRMSSDSGVTYDVPEGFTLEDIDVIAEPIRYSDLNDKTVSVNENNYESSYSLELKRK